MINLNNVGAFVSTPTEAGVPVRFGIYLPGIEQHDGYEVLVRVIHKEDRFNPEIKTKDFPLTPVASDPNTLWQASVTIPHQPRTHFGESGTYLYRYQLRKAGNSNPITNWFTDPFARAADEASQLSAFTTPDVVPDFHWTDDEWRVPEIADLVVYELQLEEFNETFPGVVERLDYLKSLGVNCLELMPVTSLKLDFDWGYGPLHFFAPNERRGGIRGLKHLVNECHRAGIAVILDVVYQHVDSTFPYFQVYGDAKIESPMIDGQGAFGPEINFSKEFARDYVQAANFHWLHEYHVDGFRYDGVTDLYDGPTGPGYAKMAFDVYNESLKLPRFTPSGKATPGEYSRIIQCAESLGRTKEVLSGTYSNCAWQDGLLEIAEHTAGSNRVDEHFVAQLLLDKRYVDYPETKTVHDSAGYEIDMPVIPFQYVENHDHSQLICFVKELAGDIQFGDRSEYYKLQPFAIALYTCVGIPMLWQGQEFADNYPLPNDGILRTRFQRDVDWQYFYDEEGHSLIHIYRRLGQLRRDYPALRSRRFHYYEEQSRLQDGIVAYSRESTDSKQIALVFLNFSDQKQSISVPVPEAGEYRELIDADEPNPLVRSVEQTNLRLDVDVPSHYGYIFILEPARKRPAEFKPRYVNACIVTHGDHTIVPKTANLEPKREYNLRLDIGPFSPDSAVENAVKHPFPAKLFPESETGHWLEVIVVSDDFMISKRRYSLFLPKSGPSWECDCPQGGEHTCNQDARKPYLFIPMTSPEQSGKARLRIAIYYEKNLIQSQLLTAEISGAEQKNVGYSSRIDYTLIANLHDVSFLPPRTLHILTNQNINGTHRIIINGKLDKFLAFNLTKEEMSGAGNVAREALRNVHFRKHPKSWGTLQPPKPENLLDNDNGKSKQEFINDLKRLAYTGWKLWSMLFSGRMDWWEKLQEPATIQVSRTKDSTSVFPWALVYDIPYETTWQYKPCPLLENLDEINVLKLSKCRRCPYEDQHEQDKQTNTLCPFGFWGIKHIIEQPPSMPENRDLPLVIQTSNEPPSLVAGISLALEKRRTENHLQALKCTHFKVLKYDSLQTIVTALKNPVEVVYFYCHGGWSQGLETPFLGVGINDRFEPPDITTWRARCWPKEHWEDTSPLVFLNGCHTAELTPKLLVNFVSEFTNAYAAGVIGTEITLSQPLASEAAEHFFSPFQKNEMSVGLALQQMRLHFLKKGNLLGLAYTPYCSADLHFQRYLQGAGLGSPDPVQ